MHRAAGGMHGVGALVENSDGFQYLQAACPVCCKAQIVYKRKKGMAELELEGHTLEAAICDRHPGNSLQRDMAGRKLRSRTSLGTNTCQ